MMRVFSCLWRPAAAFSNPDLMKRVGAVCTKGDRKGVYLNFLLVCPMTWDGIVNLSQSGLIFYLGPGT